MKAAAIALLAGLAIGWQVTAGWYQDKIRAQAQQQEVAQLEQALAYSKTAELWRSELDAANSRPDPEPQRVFIRTEVPASGCAGVDDGADTGRAELAAATVGRLERVIADKEAQYRQCSYRLKAWQELHKE